jgi:glycosyltransferase involved in cell wall biosynthesis
VVLAFGWDPFRKGVDVALSAAETLVASGRDVVLVLVGGGNLESYVADRLRRSTPPWLRVLAPRESVADLYAAADLFLSASRAEGFPYAVGEALANGLPVVTSDIAGVEWARALDAAVFFPSGAAPAAAVSMAHALDRPAERRAVAAVEARRFAAARLSLGGWAERVMALYRTVLGGRFTPRTEPIARVASGR